MKSKLRTFSGWEIQTQKIIILVIFIPNYYLQKNDIYIYT